MLPLVAGIIGYDTPMERFGRYEGPCLRAWAGVVGTALGPCWLWIANEPPGSYRFWIDALVRADVLFGFDHVFLGDVEYP